MVDKNAVKKVAGLAQEHFGHHAHPHGVYPADIAINAKLKTEVMQIPEDLSMRKVEEIFVTLKLAPSEAYIKKFRGEAILFCMGAEAQAARDRRDLILPTVGVIAERLENKWK